MSLEVEDVEDSGKMRIEELAGEELEENLTNTVRKSQIMNSRCRSFCGRDHDHDEEEMNRDEEDNSNFEEPQSPQFMLSNP